jgi:hypothetical protein
VTQITNSPEESLVRGIDPGERFAVIQSRGDLTPGAPGNADGTWEVFLLDLGTLSVTQLTGSAGDSTFLSVSRDGRWIALETTGEPAGVTNPDGSSEVLMHEYATGNRVALTDSAGDSFFGGFDVKTRRAAIVSNGDLTPGAPGNADGSFEVFVRDLRKGVTTQITGSPTDSFFGGFEPRKGKWAAVLSQGDLTPGAPGNPDGSEELYFVKLRKKPGRFLLRQVTDGTDPVGFGGWAPRGRWAAVDTTSDLKPGKNLDGSREVFRVKAKKRPRVKQLTRSTADSFVGGFAQDRRTLFVESYGDLDPKGPGNADGSREVYRVRYR